MTYGGYTYGSMLINFFSFTILSRLLLPSEYGVVALITVFTGFVSIFADAGLSYAVIRSDYRTTFHKALNNLTLLFGIGLFCVVALLAYPISAFYNDPQLLLPTYVFSLFFVLKSFSIVPQAILNKGLEFNYIGRSQLIANILATIVSISMAFMGFSFWALIVPQLFNAFFLYLQLNRRAKLPLKIYPSAYTKAGFEKSKWLMKNLLGFNLINYWARNADHLIIGKLYSKADLGIYSKSYSLLTLPLGLISSLFGTILFPSLKDLHSKGGDVKAEYGNVLGIISLINYPVGVVLVLFAYPLVKILWGKDWLMAADFVPYFGVLVLSQTLIATSGSFFLLIKKERVMLWLGGVSAIVSVAFIAVGSMFSVLDVARFYALGSLIVGFPLHVYFAQHRTFGFSWNFIFVFWFPKWVFSLLILASIWLDVMPLAIVSLVLLLIHLLYLQRRDIGLILTFARNKFIN